MTDEEFKEYISGRYSKMLKFYDEKAILNKRLHRLSSLYILVVSIAVSPIALIWKDYAQVIAATIPASVSVIAAIAAEWRFHDNWLRYRAAWDALNHEIWIAQAELTSVFACLDCE